MLEIDLFTNPNEIFTKKFNVRDKITSSRHNVHDNYIRSPLFVSFKENLDRVLINLKLSLISNLLE